MDCPSCGSANPATAKFCHECGASLVAASAPPSGRRVVTVLFADVVGSTAMGEKLDPEPLRRRMSKTFAQMRAILQRHGGTVEKFIGDAVMAVFGTPTLHEDDPLRAVRAAAELRDQIPIELRIGVNTGEVVVGDASSGETLVTGDPVNTAARLQAAAGPGEILIGHETLRQVRDAVDVTEAEPIQAKGKADRVPAHRLLRVARTGEGHARRLDAPMVGRERELARLRSAWADVLADRRCALFTLLGPAGVGKSRLVREFLTDLDDATVLRGRALPYGEAITYRPLAESLHELAGIGDGDSHQVAVTRLRDRLAALDGDSAIADRLATAIGLSDEPATADEIRWAAGRLFTALAAQRPLVIVWDDLQWAEPALLDLVNDIVERARDVPILFLVPARSELLEIRPGWAGGSPNSSTAMLASLDRAASDQLLSALPGGEALPAELRRRILDAADGIPLFVEELVGVMVDDGIIRRADGGWVLAGEPRSIRVPGTIQALLAARLDRLDHHERAIAQRASVIGRTFEISAITAISPGLDRSAVAEGVASLARKELVRADPSLPAGEGFRFRHLLIRDAAYAGMSKEDRAALHERYAEHLERAVPERADELAEIIAHHLREADRYRFQVGAERNDLGERAAAWLLRAARGALGRDDALAAEKLARAVLQTASTRPETGTGARLILGELLIRVGRIREAEGVLQAALAIASEHGDERLAAHARIELLHVAHHVHPETWIDETRVVAPEVVEVFTRLGDDFGLARAWQILGVAEQSDAAASHEHTVRALRHAERSGDRVEISRAVSEVATSAQSGPTPVSEALPAVRALAARPELTPSAAADLAGTIAMLEAMAGDPAAVEHMERAIEAQRDLGLAVDLGFGLVGAGWVHLFRDELEVAERYVREGYDVLSALGEQSLSGYLAVQVAIMLVRRERFDEAARLIDRVRRVDAGDAVARALWRGVQARIDASRGGFASARRLADEALELVDRGQVTRYALLLMDKAWVLEAAGARDEAEAALREARELLARKENVALLRQVDAWLADGGYGSGPNAEVR